MGVRRFIHVAIVVALTGAGAACTRDDQRAGGPPPGLQEPKSGGTLVVGAAAEPACADWYSPCGNSFWGIRTMALQTLPAPMEFLDGQYRPSSLLVGEPVVEAGPPQRVTYRINPQAVWSDGTPITAGDFRYSWEQGKSANFRGMSDIASVDDSDPRAAVVTWTDVSASWRDRFRPILPKHLLEGRDRNAEMKDGYSFSGGPWKIDHWTKNQEVKLVRNQRYWGTPAHLDAVVFKVILDSAAYQQAYRTGQVDMILLTAGLSEALDLKTLPDTAFEVSPSLTYATFVLNTKRPPLESKAVRQALIFATDRDAIATHLLGPLQRDARATQSVMSPANKEWYSEAFAKYKRDLTKVSDLMRVEGWTRGTDGYWTRGDSRAQVEISVAAGNRVAELSAEIVQSQWRDAGFDVSINVATNAALGSDVIPKGNYQVVFASVAPGSPDPELCQSYCSKNIPTDANRFQGANISRASSPAVDDIWERVNRELDPVKRRELVRRGQEALADEAPVLPLAGMLDVFVSNSTKLGGPVNANPAFLRLSEWFCKTACG